MLLLFIFLLLSFTILFLYFNINKNTGRLVSLFSSGVTFILSCFILITFDTNNSNFQNYLVLNLGSSFSNLVFSFGFDGISILFFWLTSLLIFLCILFIWEDFYLKEYLINLLVIELLLLLVFSVLDLFLFYIFFEAILIPMYLIIGIWGS
jgi:NADH-quinone oxidoreductase subunit M